MIALDGRELCDVELLVDERRRREPLSPYRTAII